MAAAYDNYDYPHYWEGREYEHKSEVMALKKMLEKIPSVNKIMDIGAGYGRLTPVYIHRAKRVLLTDPSAHSLKIAKQNIKDKKVKFIQSKAENLPNKVKNKSVDLIICIRVAHHIKDLDKTFKILYKLLSPNGYIIFEFPNKRHAKAILSRFLKGDFTYPLDIFTKDIRSKKSKKKNTLPFKNYHPQVVFDKFKESGFKIVTTRSVSNIRSSYFKKHFSLKTLLAWENILQEYLSDFSPGPSIFVLAKKKG